MKCISIKILLLIVFITIGSAKGFSQYQAPDFNLKNLKGETVSLSAFKGKIVIIDFWATWCGPCVAAFPAMQKTAELYKNNKNIVFLFINTRETQNDPLVRTAAVAKFMAAKPFNFNVLLDERIPGQNAYDIVSKYKVVTIPVKFVIDQTGLVRHSFVGYNGDVNSTVAELSNAIEEVLSKPELTAAEIGAYTVTGKVKKLDMATKAYLYYVKDGINLIDSTAVKDGVFHFEGFAAEPLRARLILDHLGKGMHLLGYSADARIVYLEKGNIKVVGGDSVKYATVSGSPLNQEYVRYSAGFAALDKASAILSANYDAEPIAKRQGRRSLDLLLQNLEKIRQEKEGLQFEYARQNPNSYFGLEALTDAALGGIEVGIVEPIFKNLSPALKNSKAGLEFAKLIEASRGTSIGAMAPDFTQDDVNGKAVSLSDFKGKYVLLDFWASWCSPCRAENPQVVRAYQAFKAKNFTVLGVSLDQSSGKSAWLAAIEKDGLTWTQVSDLKAFDNAVAKQYGIKSIPQNLLIDPSGKIVGKNLHGEDLSKKLAELLNTK